VSDGASLIRPTLADEVIKSEEISWIKPERSS